MFRSPSRQFEEDPFFTDPFQIHHDRMRQMMRAFPDPFAQSLTPRITDGRNRTLRGEGQSSTTLQHNEREVDFFSNPVALMDSMRNRMQGTHRNFGNIASEPNSHSFSTSSVMSYCKVGDEPAKVFKASSQTRCAPGGIKETRQCLKDSDTGLEKMSIGHHIQDRGHVIERKENRKTGEKELNQDFQNMDETEAQSFDDEWQREVSRFQVSTPMSRLEAPRHRTVHRAAITGPQETGREAKGEKANNNELNITGSNIKKQ
ncbi:Myeloid leukemia factor 1 [Triplophysa tibetana]|uniref:Myeloid leukemia factor 1 n=1 Tax=Triplophysa tibetana TaxID=1572043 RepID=A0A5A9MYS3_9TELE|nr:Myeloid leukemia factor 1 [Triplophysa tibetana]